MKETRIFLDGVDVTAVTKSFWPDDGVIELWVEDEGGKAVLKHGLVEVRTVDVETVAVKPD